MGRASDRILINSGPGLEVSRESIEAFLVQGGNSPALGHITQVLRQVYAGQTVSDRMFAAFHETGLLAPVEIEVKIDDRQSFMLKDMLTISRSALSGLDGTTLQALNQAGFLAMAFHVLSSMGNLSRMITLKTERNAAMATV